MIGPRPVIKNLILRTICVFDFHNSIIVLADFSTMMLVSKLRCENSDAGLQFRCLKVILFWLLRIIVLLFRKIVLMAPIIQSVSYSTTK